MSEDFASIGMQIDTTDLNRANTGLDQFGRKVKGAQDTTNIATNAMQKGFKSVHLAVTGALSALLSVGAAVGTIRQFETSMSQVAAVSRATTAELQKMRDVAKDLGSTTEFTAAQAADGLRFLAMAGFSASEAMQAIPAVLDLATASAMGLAEAADIASNVISGFGLEAGAAAEVADVLAAASSRANTNVAQLGRAMSTVAPISAALGIDLADTASAIGVLSDAGIQGERAGTALRGVLASLAGPTTQAQAALANYGLTVADVNPETRALTEIFGELRERGLSTADAMVIFGREAASGALVLTEASKRVGEFGNELRDVDGAAKEMAATMRDNLGGDANSAISALQGLAIALGDAGLTAALRFALQAFTDLVRMMTTVVNVFGAVVGYADDLRRAMFNLGTSQSDAEIAISAVADALTSETAALEVLIGSMPVGTTMSREAATAKLEEAQAILAKIDAARAEALQLLKMSEAYQEAASYAENLAGRVDLVRKVQEDAAMAGEKIPAHLQVSNDLMQIMVEQAEKAQKAVDDMVASSLPLSDEYNAAQEAVDQLRAALEAATGNVVTITEETTDTAGQLSIAERLAQALSGALGLGAENASAGAQNASAFAEMLRGAASAASVLFGWINRAVGLLGSLGAGLSNLGGIAGLVGNATSGLGGVLGNILNSDGATAAMSRLQQLGSGLSMIFERSKAAAVAQDAFASSVGSAGGAAGGAAKKVEDFADEIERLEDAADPTRKFVREMEKLDQLRALENGLSDGAYAQGVRDLNEELVNSTPLLSSMNDAFGQMVDYMFDGFKDGMKGILNIFVNTLKQMAAMAIKNRITLSIGAAFSGGAGAAAAGVPGGGGILNNILGLGGSGGALSGIGSGLMGVFSGGGLGSSFANLGGLLSGSVSGWGAVGAALPAAGLLVGVPLLLGALFKKTEVLVAEGVRARIEGASLELDSYEKTKTNNGLGISSGFKRDFDRLDDAVQSAVQTRLDATITALEQFGFGTDLTGFSFSKRTEIKDGETFEGESEEVIREALDAVTEYLADGALEVFMQAGETVSMTLERLSTSLAATNQSLDFFGGTLLPISLDGAAAAAALTDLYGGLENFAASGQFLFENFTTTEQKLERATTDLNAAFEALRVDVPKTHQAYLDLINSQDLMTEGGRELHASLGALAPLFTAVAGTADEAAAELAEYEAGLQESINLRAEEKKASREANLALEAAMRVAEKAARRAQEIARNEAAFEALEAQVPQMASALARSIAAGFADATSGIDLSVLPDEIAQSVRDNAGKVVEGMDAIDRALMRFTGTFDFGLRDNDGNTIFEGYIDQLERGFREGEKTLAQTQALVETLQDISFADFADFAATDPQRLFEGLSEGARMSSGELANVSENMLAVVENIENGTLSFDEYVTDAIDNFNSAVLQFAITLSSAAETVRDGINQTVGDVFDALDLVADPAEAAASNLSRLADAIEVLSEANTFVEENIGRGASAGFGNPESPIIQDRIPDLYGPISEVVTAAMQRVSDAIIEPIKDELFALAPDFEQAAGALFRPLAEIISTVGDGELDAYGDAVSRISKMFADGELSVDLYNDTFAILNSALDGALQPVEDLADAVDGLSSESQNLLERFNRLKAELAGPDALRDYELGLLPDDAKDLQEAVWYLEQQLEDAADAARLADKALQEKLGLERRILELNEDTAAIRELELAALEPGNRALQEHVWALEDEADAAQRAEAVLQERLGLERRILELNGNTVALRELEIAALDPSNRALQGYIHTLEDAAAAAAKAKAVEDERLGLEGRLLQLNGNTAELRRRELLTLDESNRELQKLIYAREDEIAATEAMKSALDGLASAVNAESQALAQAVEEAERKLEAAVNALDRIFQQLEDKVSDALSALSDAIDAESAALEQSVTDAEGVFSGALSALGDALDAESQRIDGVLSDLIAQRDSLYDQLFPQEAAQNGLEIRDLLSDGLDLAKQLANIARDVLGQNVEIAEQQRQAAFRQLQGMLAAGAIDAENVADIAQRASEFNSRQYATLEEMQLDQLVTANTINELSKLQEKLAQEAQAEEEARVAEARDVALAQIDLLEAQIVEQQNALTALDDIRGQFDIATGVLLSIDEAIAGVEAAQTALATAQQNAADRQSELDVIREDFGLLIEAVTSVEDAVRLVEETQFDLEEARLQAQSQVTQLDAIRTGFVTLSGETASLEVAIGAVETAVRELDTLSDYAQARESELEQIRNQFELIGNGIEDALAQAASTTASALSAVLQAVGNMDGAQAVIDQAGSGSSGGSGTSGGSSNPAPSPGYAAAIAEIERQRSYFQGELNVAQGNLSAAQSNRDSIIGTATSLYNELTRIYERKLNYTATMPEYAYYSENLPVYENLILQIAPAKSAVEAAEAEVRRLQNALNQVNAAAANIPAFADGGIFSGGLRLVGERGPELEVTGPARYYSAEQTRSMMSGGGGETASETRQLRGEVRQIAEQNEQNAAELRQMRRFLKTLADIEEDRRAEELAKAKEEAAA